MLPTTGEKIVAKAKYHVEHCNTLDCYDCHFFKSLLRSVVIYS